MLAAWFPARPFAGLVFLGLISTSGLTPAAADQRSTELLLYQCSSSLGRRDVTLFANGTVRLRQGPWAEQELYLDELLPEELASYVEQLRRIQTSDAAPSVDLPAEAPTGDWAEDCQIRLELAGAPPAKYSFSAYEIPPLVVSRLIHLAEDLAGFTRSPALAERLPREYRPRPGDVLRTAAGRRFRVGLLTSDERGVELQEVGTPLMIIVPVGELSETFAALEEPGAAGANRQWPEP